jgi:hypothetical protein
MTKNNEEYVYISEAIELITKKTKKPISDSRLRSLCIAGELDAYKEKRDWLISKQSVLNFKHGKPGIRKGFKFSKPRKKVK